MRTSLKLLSPYQKTLLVGNSFPKKSLEKLKLDQYLWAVGNRPFEEIWFCPKEFHSISGIRVCVEFCKNSSCFEHPKHAQYLEKYNPDHGKYLEKFDYSQYSGLLKCPSCNTWFFHESDLEFHKSTHGGA